MVNLVRYADDFIITGRTREMLEDKVKPLVREFLTERGLELSEEKTAITHIDTGFDFLGVSVRKYRGVCLTRPSAGNVKAFLEKVRAIIKSNKSATAGGLVVMLNPLIRGWANYHRHGASKRTYASVDSSIYECLWQWARRRHPDRSGKWVRRKYFGTLGGNHWSFFGEVPTAGGQSRSVWLRRTASTPIRRHTPIRSKANPYDPAWETYFEEREGLKMEVSLPGRRKLSYLWKQQKGICPVCQKRITRLSGWRLHHPTWRVLGGSDSAWNQTLLHPQCHDSVHNQSSSRASPGPAQGLGEA